MLELAIAIGSMIFSVIGYLLRRKDDEQAELIAKLFTKHDSNEAAIQAVRLQIASEHYHKNELDARFLRLEATFQKGFDDLGRKFDRLSEALVRHEVTQRQHD